MEEVKKKIGRPRKTIMEVEMPSVEEPSNEISLADALEKGIVLLKEDVEKIIKEEIKKHKDNLREELGREMAQEDLNNRLLHLRSYKEGTGITSDKFAELLMKMNVPKENLKYLRDEHIHLPRKEIWRIIRQNEESSRLKPHHKI